MDYLIHTEPHLPCAYLNPKYELWILELANKDRDLSENIAFSYEFSKKWSRRQDFGGCIKWKKKYIDCSLTDKGKTRLKMLKKFIDSGTSYTICTIVVNKYFREAVSRDLREMAKARRKIKEYFPQLRELM